MEHEFSSLDRLANRARQEITPSGDVRAAVIRRLRAGGDTSLVRPLVVFATGYAAAGIVAAGIGISLLNAINDPLSVMFQFGTVISP